MTRRPTPGDWQAGALRRSTADWPFDWVGDITSGDPIQHDRAFIATVRQSGARPFEEALTNLNVMARAPTLLRLIEDVVHVLDMSDPDHPTFADSAADCLDALLEHEAPLRAILAELRASRPFVPIAS
ncbi:hypothetical protein [Novosphingobium sp. FSW06-99]|uniref:hypothetical protein n=1 Tax=Novosphingobium sp. FSW06-99 TaxID=1739113 RepID=UPI00076C3588|nr:hypothetical protein [Novosphingobium sp. FSW06-99]KUR78020.1 hypothetical protein AQZ49_08270 [Novosphingobium sp. FSW06-99]